MNNIVDAIREVSRQYGRGSVVHHGGLAYLKLVLSSGRSAWSVRYRLRRLAILAGGHCNNRGQDQIEWRLDLLRAVAFWSSVRLAR